jgi:phage terminase large subunit
MSAAATLERQYLKLRAKEREATKGLATGGQARSGPPSIVFGGQYARMFEGGWDNCVLYGGRFTAKSWHAAMWAILMADQHSFQATMFRQFQNSIRDSVKRNLEKHIEALGWQSRFRVTREEVWHTRTETCFRFKGLHNNLGSIRSAETLDLAGMEEGQYVSEEAINELWPTIRGEGAKFICTMNPLTPDVPIDKMFRCPEHQRPARSLVLETTIADNPMALRSPRALDAYFKMMRDDPELFAHIYGGAYRKGASGAIFKIQVGVIPPERLRLYLPLYGMDFGVNDPSVIMRVYVMWYERIVYVEAEAVETNLGLNELSGLIGRVLLKEDAIITADPAGNREIEYLQGQGFNVRPARKGAGSILAGIKWLKDFDIVVNPACTKTIEEARLYRWKRNNLGGAFDEPQDAYNHTWDSIRYAVEDVKGPTSDASSADDVEDERKRGLGYFG